MIQAYFKASLHGGGGPQVSEVTRLFIFLKELFAEGEVKIVE